MRAPAGLEANYVSRRHWMVPVSLLLPFAALGVTRFSDVLVAWRPRWQPQRWAAVSITGALTLFALVDGHVMFDRKGRRVNIVPTALAN